jgi:hypothetical protein
LGLIEACGKEGDPNKPDLPNLPTSYKTSDTLPRRPTHFGKRNTERFAWLWQSNALADQAITNRHPTSWIAPSVVSSKCKEDYLAIGRSVC